MELSNDQRDCLQELCNVAMGQAADSLARLLNRFIHLSVPRVEVTRRATLPDVLRLREDEPLLVGEQCFTALDQSGFGGQALVVFAEEAFQDLVELLNKADADTDAGEQELLSDITAILAGNCMRALAEQLCGGIALDEADALGQHCSLPQLLAAHNAEEQLLSVKIHYELEQRRFSCDLLLLLPEPAGRYLLQQLDAFVAEM